MTRLLWEHLVISYILTLFPLLLIDSGKVVNRIFKGDEQMAEVKSYLKSSINSYNNALVNINLRIVVKVYELLKGIYLDVSLRYFD